MASRTCSSSGYGKALCVQIFSWNHKSQNFSKYSKKSVLFEYPSPLFTLFKLLFSVPMWISSKHFPKFPRKVRPVGKYVCCRNSQHFPSISRLCRCLQINGIFLKYSPPAEGWLKYANLHLKHYIQVFRRTLHLLRKQVIPLGEYLKAC